MFASTMSLLTDFTVEQVTAAFQETGAISRAVEWGENFMSINNNTVSTDFTIYSMVNMSNYRTAT